MKYDVFMRTRTYSGDYDWIRKPEYMPADVYKTCQSIIALRERQNFDRLSEEDWYGNFFFIKAGGCSMLARMAKTKYSDSFGRSIFSFEGVCVKTENEKRFFLDIPNLINAMLPPAKSFRVLFEEEEAVPDTFETESPINPLKSAEVPMHVHPDVKHNDAFKTLMKLTAYADPEGFIFGKNARDFSDYTNKSIMGIKHVFDFENPDDANVREAAFDEKYNPIVCNYAEPVPTGVEKTAVYLFIQETDGAYRYQWQIRQYGTEERAVKYATRFYDINDRVPMKTLEIQKESIKGFLTAQGWKKQELGLRFEKETY